MTHWPFPGFHTSSSPSVGSAPRPLPNTWRAALPSEGLPLTHIVLGRRQGQYSQPEFLEAASTPRPVWGPGATRTAGPTAARRLRCLPRGPQEPRSSLPPACFLSDLKVLAATLGQQSGCQFQDGLGQCGLPAHFPALSHKPSYHPPLRGSQRHPRPQKQPVLGACVGTGATNSRRCWYRLITPGDTTGPPGKKAQSWGN